MTVLPLGIVWFVLTLQVDDDRVTVWVRRHDYRLLELRPE